MSCVCSGGSGRDGDRHTQQVTVALNLLEQNPGWISLHLDGDRLPKQAVQDDVEAQGETYTYTRQRESTGGGGGRPLNGEETKGVQAKEG